MADGRYIAYYRVSTQRQGDSGLGLEAQQHAVTDFLNGGKWCLLGSFTEVESGKVDERPELAKALAACRVKNATLVIAKLDRLSRNAHFLLGLRDAGVHFICADMPEATEFTIGILALVAQHEREAISKRTREALQAAKRRGVKLGNPANLTPTARALGPALGNAAKTARQHSAPQTSCRVSVTYRQKRAAAHLWRRLQPRWTSAGSPHRVAANGTRQRSAGC